jgi:hypothetical protein
VCRGHYETTFKLNGKFVPVITAYLFDKGGDESPARLAGRNALFSAGSKIYGQGFLFDDGDADASPLVEMEELLRRSPLSKQRVLPYMGGDELNSSPTHSPHRYVINLSDILDEKGLRDWPELADVVRRKVKPYRDQLGANPNNVPLKRRWWAYQAHRPELYAALSQMRRALACSQTSKYIAFAFLPTNIVLSQKLNVFLFEEWAAFGFLQSRLHEVWALFFGSTLEDRPVYTPSDCFETFSVPPKWLECRAVESAAKAYYETRDATMVRSGMGLTDIYNCFHDRDDQTDAEIWKLRELHAAMDRAVLDAYGWSDIPTECEFLLDYEIDEEEWGSKKKPYRYRWPDDVRDEVLARLLELNAEHAREEARSGVAAQKKSRKSASGKKSSSDSGALF